MGSFQSIDSAGESNSVIERRAVVGVNAVSDAVPLILGLLGAL